MILVLPYPVTANLYWRSTAYIDKQTKLPRAVTYPSGEAKAYKEQVGWLAKVAGYKEPSKRPVSLKIVLCPRLLNKNGDRTGVVMDLSNAWKVAEDALQGIVYVNDRQVKKLALEYGPGSDKGALIVEVAEFVPAPAPLFAEAAA